jgi:hypothetical protein
LNSYATGAVCRKRWYGHFVFRRLKDAWRRSRERRREHLAEDELYRDEAERRRFDHETQKWGGTVSQPKLPDRDW